jgi:predicted glycoside hydrolase/deacetylase ChbG (UPF0249 family)
MLIFNADDYGLTDIDVDRILYSVDRNVIKSTTIVSNYVTEGDLVKLRSAKNISTGIHLNLVEGLSLLEKKPLNDKRTFIKKIILNKINYTNIEKEMALQIENVLDNGVTISHIDSHQNMHYIPSILKIVSRLSEKYHINKIRGLDSEYFWFTKYSKGRALMKNTISKIFNSKYLNNTRHTNRIIMNAPGLGFDCMSIDHALRLWDDALRNKYNPNMVYEIPCHLYLSDFEYELYNSREFFQIIRKNKVKIGCFYDV